MQNLRLPNVFPGTGRALCAQVASLPFARYLRDTRNALPLGTSLQMAPRARNTQRTHCSRCGVGGGTQLARDNARGKRCFATEKFRPRKSWKAVYFSAPSTLLFCRHSIPLVSLSNSLENKQKPGPSNNIRRRRAAPTESDDKRCEPCQWRPCFRRASL